jgi:hypothetical protein
VNKFLFASILMSLKLSDVFAASTEASYRMSVRHQLGYHLMGPKQDLATNRILLDANQSLSWKSGFEAQISGRLRSESAYGSNPDRFTAEQASKDSSEIEWRDVYLQYKKGPILFRLGQQQIVWGEAFGFFYADLVNPKDLRESALFGLFEFADLRDPIPLADFQVRGRDWTLQAIYAPFASKNRLPRWNSPLSPLKTSDLNGGVNPTVDIIDDVKLDESEGDFGGRISKRWGSVDLSIFGFSYLDRMPYFEVVSFQPAPFFLQIRERQTRVQSYGLTATYDWDGYLIRFESVFTQDRKFNLIDQGIGVEEGQDSTAVLGLDFPTSSVWMLSLQLSHNWIEGLSEDPATAKRRQSLAAFRISRDIGSKQSLELMSHILLEDGSHYHAGRWIFARSSRLEYLFGVEVLEGSKSSLFGRIREGSRALVGIRGFFDG